MWFAWFFLRWVVALVALIPTVTIYVALLFRAPTVLYTLNQWVSDIIEALARQFNVGTDTLVWLNLMMDNDRMVFGSIWILSTILIHDLLRQARNLALAIARGFKSQTPKAR